MKSECAMVGGQPAKKEDGNFLYGLELGFENKLIIFI